MRQLHKQYSEELLENKGSQNEVVRLSEDETNGEVSALTKKLQMTEKSLVQLRKHLITSEQEHEDVVMHLQEKLMKLKGEGNNSKLKAELKAKDLELTQLQSLIGDIEAQKEEEINMQTFQLRQTINDLKEKLQDSKVFASGLRQEIKDKDTTISELTERFRSLQDDMKEKKSIKREYDMLQDTYARTRAKLEESLQADQEYVEKYNTYAILTSRHVVKQLIISYITKTQVNRVLRLMSEILNFTEEEKIKTGVIARPGFFSRWLKPSDEYRNNEDVLADKNISDLWVEFLQNETQDDYGSNDSETHV